jgi:DNA-binding transcriptional LysR family regulator
MTERTGIEPDTIAEVRQLVTVFQMIRRNPGVAVVPQDAARVCERPGLIAVPLIDRTLIRTLGIVTSDFHHPTEFESALVDSLRKSSGVFPV